MVKERLDALEQIVRTRDIVKVDELARDRTRFRRAFRTVPLIIGTTHV